MDQLEKFDTGLVDQYVLVTDQQRGVSVGWLEAFSLKHAACVLRDRRQVFRFYTGAHKGVYGLCVSGPVADSLISFEVPGYTLIFAVSKISPITAKAKAAFDAIPGWSKDQ